jgi:hypothetical protein
MMHTLVSIICQCLYVYVYGYVYGYVRGPGQHLKRLTCQLDPCSVHRPYICGYTTARACLPLLQYALAHAVYSTGAEQVQPPDERPTAAMSC